MHALVLAVVQVGVWQVGISAPTVGDTIWVERTVSIDAEQSLRAPRWTLKGAVETLGPGMVVATGNGERTVRYPLVAWEPGTHTVMVPGPWRMLPRGAIDTVPAQSVSFTVVSVLTGDSRTPRSPRGPVMSAFRSTTPVILASLSSVLVLGALWRWRRPRRRLARAATPPPRRQRSSRAIGISDPQVVASRATLRLRAVLALHDVDLHRGLTTEQCIAGVRARHPEWPTQRIADTLRGLDRARFAPLCADDAELLSGEIVALEEQLAGASE